MMKTRVIVGLVICILGCIHIIVPSYIEALSINCREPPFISSGVTSNVLFVLDNSGSMNEFVYHIENSGLMNFDPLPSRTYYQTPPALPTSCRNTIACNSCDGRTSSCCSAVPLCSTPDTTGIVDRSADMGVDCKYTCSFDYRCSWRSSGKDCYRSYRVNPSCTADTGNVCIMTTTWESSNERIRVTLSGGSNENYTASAGYDPGRRYYGYFDPDKAYKYDNAKHYFYSGTGVEGDPNKDGWPAATLEVRDPNDANKTITLRGSCLSSAGTCDKFSGNLLNWLSMRRLDVAKKVLTGGRLGGDTSEYVLVGMPSERGGQHDWKVFNDNGRTYTLPDGSSTGGVYYTPFRSPFGVYFNNFDLQQRTGANGKFVPLMTFFKASSYDDPTNTAIWLGPRQVLGADASYGNLGESKLVNKRSYEGSYYVAVKVGTVARDQPPTGVVQNMASKVRFGFMHFNYGRGPAEGYTFGDEVGSWDIDGDGVVDKIWRYADGGRIVHRIGDTSRTSSFQRYSDGSPVEVYSVVQTINELTIQMNTPLAEVLKEAMRYFRQQPPSYAWADEATGERREDYLVNNDWDPYYYATPEPAGKKSCAKSYIIFVSDGEANNDSPCKTYCPGACTQVTGCTDIAKTFRFNGSGYLDDIAFKLHTEDNRPDIADTPDKQTITLYSIFLFDQADSSRDAMARAGLAGGFVDLDRDGQPGKAPVPARTGTWRDAYTWPGYDGYYEWDSDRSGWPDTFFEAQDGYLIEQYIQAIFNQVALGGAAGAVATISQDTKQADVVVRGAFDAIDPTDRTRYLWYGHLEVYWPDDTGMYEFEHSANVGLFCEQMTVGHCSGSKCCWDAGQFLRNTAPSSLVIFSFLNGGRVDFTDANASQFADFMRKQTKSPQVPTDGIVDEDYVKSMMQWVRGSVDAEGYPLTRLPTGCDPLNPTNLCYGPFRRRHTAQPTLGDIVYSTPVVIGPPTLGNVSAVDPDVKSFYEFRNNNLHRARVAYVGANDGMLHAFLLARWLPGTDGIEHWDYNCTASDGYPKCGEQIWAYMPSNMLGALQIISDTSYGRTDSSFCRHRSMVDLSPKSWDVYIQSPACSTPCPSRCWRTVLIGGEREGGDTYFSIDVTDPLDPRVLWEHSVLKNLAVAYDSAGTKLSLPFRERDTDGDGLDDVYFHLKLLPMTWSEPVIGRVRIPPSDVGFYRYVPDETDPSQLVLRKRQFSTSTCSATQPDGSTKTEDDSDNKRHVAFIGGGFRVYDPLNLGVTPDPNTDQVKKALTKGHLLALDIETGENFFQVLWPLLVKARTDAGLMPDVRIPHAAPVTYIPYALGDMALMDVWDNREFSGLTGEALRDDPGRFGEDGFVDRLYVGDLLGNFYRMTLNLKDYGSSYNSAYHKGIHIESRHTKPVRLNPADPTSCDERNNFRGCRQPLTYAPAVAVDSSSGRTSHPTLRVLVGTGKFDDVVDANDDKSDVAKMSFYNWEDYVKLYPAGTDRTTAIPSISGTPEITPVEGAFPNTVTGSLSGAGFLIHGTNFGISHGSDLCAADSVSPDPWRAMNCSQTTTSCASAENPDCVMAVRDSTHCCNWVTSNGTGDCCEGTGCPNSSRGCELNTTTGKCPPCWNCVFDFANPGERVVGRAVIAGGYALFATYAPPNEGCQSGGSGRLYILDYRCKTFPDGLQPLSDSSGLTVTNLQTGTGTGLYGLVVDLGSGMPSRPVLDSKGESVLIQKSDGGFVKIPAPKSQMSPLQFKGWEER